MKRIYSKYQKVVNKPSFNLGFITTLLFSTALVFLINAVVFYVYWHMDKNENHENGPGQDSMIVSICFFIVLLLPSNLVAEEYLYPVMETVDAVYLLHQRDQQLTLLHWDPLTKQVFKELPDWYNPTNCTLLPNKQGFSFIDDDTIRIKFFASRSVYTIPIEAPLYNFSVLQWIDDETLYCSAFNQGHFGIYEITCNGTVTSKVEDPCVDCMYPQKLGSHLYYIAREFIEDTYYYSIRRCAYSASCHSSQRDEIIINSGTKPLAFLSLHPVEGNWVISYDFGLSSQEESVCFVLEQFDFQGNINSKIKFKIPYKIMENSLYRVCESITPVLPRVSGNTIYYVSDYAIHIHDMVKQKDHVFSIRTDCLVTVPLLSGMYGGSLDVYVSPYYIYFDAQASITHINIPHI